MCRANTRRRMSRASVLQGALLVLPPKNMPGEIADLCVRLVLHGTVEPRVSSEPPQSVGPCPAAKPTAAAAAAAAPGEEGLIRLALEATASRGRPQTPQAVRARRRTPALTAQLSLERVMRHVRWTADQEEEKGERCCDWHEVAGVLRERLERMRMETPCDPAWRWYAGWQCAICGAVHEEELSPGKATGSVKDQCPPECALCECEAEVVDDGALRGSGASSSSSSRASWELGCQGPKKKFGKAKAAESGIRIAFRQSRCWRVPGGSRR